MNIMARVFSYEITDVEYQREIEKLKHTNHTDKYRLEQRAMNEVIDRYLLLHEAVENGFIVTDQEYEDLLIEIIDSFDSPGDFESSLFVKGMNDTQIERLLRSKMLIKKFIDDLCCTTCEIPDDELRKFYDDQKGYFVSDPEVRASHILIKGTDAAAELKAKQVFDSIRSPAEFYRLSNAFYDCHSKARCGDLGYFHRGKLIPEIEDIAFSLKIGEISQPFSSPYGFHILMLTDIRPAQCVPFDDIKDTLKARLQHINKELKLKQHLDDIRRRYRDNVQIIEPEKK